MFDKTCLQNKNILITGGGTGTGRKIAEGFASVGADLVLCGRRIQIVEQTAEQIRSKYGVAVDSYECDVSVHEQIQNMVNQIWQKRPLTGVVNNASTNFISKTEWVTPIGFEKVCKTVLMGTFCVSRSIASKWIHEGKTGSILNIGLSWIETGQPLCIPSSAAKAGMLNMSRAMALEWAGKGIRVNVLSPGQFPGEEDWQNIFPNENLSQLKTLERAGKFQELQNLCIFLMADGCEYLTAENIFLDGGMHLRTHSETVKELIDMDAEAWEGLLHEK